MMGSGDIKASIKDFILREFLPGEDPAQLTASTPLVTAGILDSIATLKLVLFLEERFGISFAAHEVSAEHLDTIERMVTLIRAKQ